MDLLTILDHLGIFAFAISGGLVAIRYEMDVFGVLVICLIPAVGGGTLRDVLLDVPVFWLNDYKVICVALLGGVAALVYRSWTKVKILVWVDALGLSLFATMGTVKAFDLGYGFITAVIMGTVTSTAGSLIRDVVCRATPLLLKEDVYATAALSGSALCYLMLSVGVNHTVSILTGFLVVFFIRTVAIHFKLSLPSSSKLQESMHSR